MTALERLHVLAGELGADELAVLCLVAERFGIGGFAPMRGRRSLGLGGWRV